MVRALFYAPTAHFIAFNILSTAAIILSTFLLILFKIVLLSSH